MPHSVLVVILLCLVGCSAIDGDGYAYRLEKFEPDILNYDESKPNDLRNIAGTLRIYEIDPAERRAFISSSSQLFNGGKSLSIDGDGAQTTITISRLAQAPDNPVKIRVVLGAPADETMTIYILERTKDGWKRISRKFLN